ncbi:CC0125/CC1285 family lipoprotein [Sphingomonas sp. CJ20]
MFKGTLMRPGLAALAAALALGGCMTATPYKPATGVGEYRTGYSDEQIESNRFRVSFAGNSLTARETVERYLLYRAAELTLQSGFDHFVLVTRDTEKRSETYSTPGAWGGAGPWGYWSPYWRYYRPQFGWRSWDPFYDDPFWRSRDFDYRTVNRYEAMAEIVMGKGPKPADNLRAFDAHEVVERLGKQIQMPTTR